jgi:hypothetical protein
MALYRDKFTVYTNCNSIYKFIKQRRKNNYKVISFIKSKGSKYTKTVSFSSIENLKNILKIARKSS